MQRKKKPGDRRPNGRHKPNGNKPNVEPFAPALIARIVRTAKARCEDPKLGTEVGILRMRGELTNAQTSACFRIASIYGAFEHYAGVSRSARSPSYDASRGEALLSDSAQAGRDERERAARKMFDTLQKQIPYPIRDAVELLCVEDRAINSLKLPALRDFLNALVSRWKQEKGQGVEARDIPLHFNHHDGDDFSQAKRDREDFRDAKRERRAG